MQDNARFAIVCGIAASLIMAGQPVVSKWGYQMSLSATDQTFLRYALSGLVTLPFMLRKGLSNAFGLGWRRAFALMLVAGPLYSLVIIGGLSWAPASHCSLIYPALTPIFSAILARWLIGRSEKSSVAGLGLLVAGVVMIGLTSVLGHAGAAGAGTWRGDLLFVLAAIMWALFIVLTRKWAANPFVVVGIVQLSSAAYVLPYLLIKGVSVLGAPWHQLLLQASYHGIGISIGAVALLNFAIRGLGSKASLFTALVPLFGVAMSILLLGEPASLSVVGGTACIVAGLVWSFAARARLAMPQTDPAEGPSPVQPQKI